MTANILRGCAAESCDRTFRQEHGGAVPGGPFPGTHAESGDVRLCEHGKVWLYTRTEGWSIDLWVRLHPLASPIRYRRALRALERAR